MDETALATIYFPMTVALRCYTAAVMEWIDVRDRWLRELGLPQ
jgi:hypothetical protein